MEQSGALEAAELYYAMQQSSSGGTASAHRRGLFFLSLTHMIHGALFFLLQALMTALPVPEKGVAENGVVFRGFPLHDYEFMRYPAVGVWVGFVVAVTGLVGFAASRGKSHHNRGHSASADDARHCHFVVVLVLNVISCIFVGLLLVMCIVAVANAHANIDFMNSAAASAETLHWHESKSLYYRTAVRTFCLCGLMLGFSLSDLIVGALTASMSCRMVCQCCSTHTPAPARTHFLPSASYVYGLPLPPPTYSESVHNFALLNNHAVPLQSPTNLARASNVLVPLSSSANDDDRADAAAEPRTRRSVPPNNSVAAPPPPPPQTAMPSESNSVEEQEEIVEDPKD